MHEELASDSRQTARRSNMPAEFVMGANLIGSVLRQMAGDAVTAHRVGRAAARRYRESLPDGCGGGARLLSCVVGTVAALVILPSWIQWETLAPSEPPYMSCGSDAGHRGVGPGHIGAHYDYRACVGHLAFDSPLNLGVEKKAETRNEGDGVTMESDFVDAQGRTTSVIVHRSGTAGN